MELGEEKERESPVVGVTENYLTAAAAAAAYNYPDETTFRRLYCRASLRAFAEMIQTKL